jgi:hypothetical protein
MVLIMQRILALTFFKLQLVDMITTRIALAHGAHEANPILQPFGTWFWAPKLAIALAISAFMFFYPRHKAFAALSPLASGIMLTLVGVYMIVVVNNLVVIWLT